MTVADVAKRLKDSVLTDERVEQAIVDVFKEIFAHFRTIIASIQRHKDVITPENIKKANYQTLLLGLLATINQAISDLALVQNLKSDKFTDLIALALKVRRSLEEFRKQLLKPAGENHLVHYKLAYNAFKATAVNPLIDVIEETGRGLPLRTDINKTLALSI